MTRHLQINPIACEAHGLCAELFPEWIFLDDWGYPIIDDRPIPPDLLEHARRAADACPTLALRLKSQSSRRKSVDYQP
ncbi:MAG TPA: ferredoxin [Solirubrobacterales bacterium]|nr:ferredoxin [Solirubrobacterales bacterium]